MGDILHGSARTTPRVRAELQASKEKSGALARRYGLSRTTVAKWRGRSTTTDARMGPRDPKSTVLTSVEEAMVVEFRRRTLLPLDDVLGCLKDSIPSLTRSSLHRCLVRHGISRLPESEEKTSKRGRFADTTIGYVHIDICELRLAEGKLIGILNKRLIATRSDAITLRRHFEPGIQQIWLPEMGVTDRCTTCHSALKETTLMDITTQPYRHHPAIPHKAEEMGCVICHRGQGAATSVEEAHKSTLAWEEPILPAKYLESSCGQCHQEDLKGTPQLNLGRRMLTQYGCVHCHTIKRPDGVVLTGTDDPPSLLHIADKTTREWIYAWLKDPQAYSTTATMPNFKLKDEDARDISAFLMASSTPASLKVVQASLDESKKVKDDADPPDQGRQSVGRIVLRILPRGTECRRQSGRRESWA